MWLKWLEVSFFDDSVIATAKASQHSTCSSRAKTSDASFVDKSIWCIFHRWKHPKRMIPSSRTKHLKCLSWTKTFKASNASISVTFFTGKSIWSDRCILNKQKHPKYLVHPLRTKASQWSMHHSMTQVSLMHDNVNESISTIDGSYEYLRHGPNLPDVGWSAFGSNSVECILRRPKVSCLFNTIYRMWVDRIRRKASRSAELGANSLDLNRWANQPSQVSS